MNGAIREVAIRCFKNDCWDLAVLSGQLNGKRSADTAAVEDDVLRRDVLGRNEKSQCVFGILLHGGFARMLTGACAIAAIVEKEDIEICLVKGEDLLEGVRIGAVGAVEDKGSRLTGDINWNRPTGELGLTGGVHSKVKRREVESK